MTGRTCSRPNCDRAKSAARGLCSTHYKQARKRAPSVPVEVVADHVAQLRAALPWERIEALTGVGRSRMTGLERRAYVCRSTAEKILAVPVLAHQFSSELAADTKVKAVGTRRRLQALARMGYGNEYLAGEIGCSAQRVKVMKLRAGFVTAVEARGVADLYRRQYLVEPMGGQFSQKVKTIAERHGWPDGWAWDDDTIDDPNAEPFTAARKASFADIIADHRFVGRSDRDIAELLGIQLDSLYMQLRRKGIPRRDQLVAS